MSPVDQLVLTDGIGDCLRACVASILDLTPEEVPNFAELDYFESLYEWLDKRGLRAIEVRFATADDFNRAYFKYSDTPVILWGDSPRFRADGVRRKQHAVVGKPCGYGSKTARDILHDPHPSRLGLHSCYGIMWITEVSMQRG